MQEKEIVVRYAGGYMRIWLDEAFPHGVNWFKKFLKVVEISPDRDYIRATTLLFLNDRLDSLRITEADEAGIREMQDKWRAEQKLAETDLEGLERDLNVIKNHLKIAHDKQKFKDLAEERKQEIKEKKEVVRKCKNFILSHEKELSRDKKLAETIIKCLKELGQEV